MKFLKKIYFTKKMEKTLLRAVVEVVVAFSVVVLLGLYGYTHNENLADDELLGVDYAPLIQNFPKNLSLATPTMMIGNGTATKQSEKPSNFIKKVLTGKVTSDTTNATSSVATSTTVTATTSIPVLVYHKINKPDFVLFSEKQRRNLKKYSVPVQVFDAQMQFVKEVGYTPLTMEVAIRDTRNNTLPVKPIVITFDDGWRSQYEEALPILTKYQIPATFYIYTDVIGAGAYMTWDNLHELVRLNMEIGDHTKNHPRLTKINPSRLEEELFQSKNLLERKLHVSVTDFAYPYGDYNASTIEAVKKYGYISARTSRHASSDDFSDLYQIRVIYAPDNLKAFKDMLGK